MFFHTRVYGEVQKHRCKYERNYFEYNNIKRFSKQIDSDRLLDISYKPDIFNLFRQFRSQTRTIIYSTKLNTTLLEKRCRIVRLLFIYVIIWLQANPENLAVQKPIATEVDGVTSRKTAVVLSSVVHGRFGKRGRVLHRRGSYANRSWNPRDWICNGHFNVAAYRGSCGGNRFSIR